MADIAALGFRIDSRDLDRAEKSSRKLTGASKHLEAAVTGVGIRAPAAYKRVGTAATLAAAANDNLARSAHRVAAAYRVVAGALGLGGALVAAMTFRTFIKNSSEAQEVQAQLAAALKSTGGVAGQTIASMNAHAAALQRVTTFGDEATNSAQALLLTFKGIRGEVFERTTEAILDTATAMRMDLKSAAVQVGKALNDPAVGLSMLTRVGITFSESQKAVIKNFVETGNLAKAQIVILKELESQFGGSARAARETLPGALKALGNAFGDLFEVSVDGSNNLIDAINRLTDTLSSPSTQKAIQNFGAWLFNAISGALNLMNRLAFVWNQLKQGDFSFLNAGTGSLEAQKNAAKRDLILGIGNRLNAGSAGSFYDAVGIAGPMGKGGGSADDKSLSKEAIKAAEKYAKLIQGANQFIAAQRLEQQALGMTEQAANALRHEQEMLNKAANDNIKLSPAQRQELAALAQQMAAVEAETSRAKEAFNFARDVTKGFFSDLKQGLQSGEGFWKSFGSAATNALNKIADKLMDLALNNLWAAAFPGGKSGGGGFLSGILGNLFGGGSGAATFNMGGSAGAIYAKGGIPGGPGIAAYSNQIVNRPTVFPMARGAGLMGEAGPEAVMPLRRGRDGRLGVSAPANSNVQVIVNNNAAGDGYETRETKERGPDGERVIIDIVKKARARGEFDSVERNRYGVRARKVI